MPVKNREWRLKSFVYRSGCGWVPATVDARAASVVNCGIYVPWVCPRWAYFFLSLMSEPELLFIPERKILRCGDAVAARTLSVTSAFILASSSCSRHVGAHGHAISTTQPGPGTIVNRNPCTFTIAATRFRPRPRPDVCLTLSDR